MSQYDEVKSVLDKYEDALLSYQRVHAVGIGYKEVDGIRTDELEIIVYVHANTSVEKYVEAEHVPLEIEGIPVEFIAETEPMLDVLPVAYEIVRPTDQARYRPLVGGIQIFLNYYRSEWVGTVGTFVKSKDPSDDHLYILSNQHVLKADGLTVFQPRPGVLNLVGSTTVTQEFPDADAGLALVNDPSDVDVNMIEDIGLVNETHDVTVDDLSKRVRKRGRTTLLTEGTIEAINVAINLVGGTRQYDCVRVRADEGELFSSPGDSGSCVVLVEDNALVGLHFAGNGIAGGASFFSKIGNVFDNLNVELPE